MLFKHKTEIGRGAPYSAIMLAPDWRVRPLDHLQWVVEQKDKRGRQLKLDGERWRPQAYCRTKDGLLCALASLAPEVDRGPLADFPAMFGPDVPPLPARWLGGRR